MPPANLPSSAVRKIRFTRVDLLLLLMVLAWGGNLSIIKIALSGFQPLAFNALRFIIASACIALVHRSVFRDHIPSRLLFRLALLGVLGNTLYQLLFITGISLSHVSHVAILLGITPVTTAGLSRILRIERVSGTVWAGIILSFAGVVLIVFGGGSLRSAGSGVMFGDLLIVTACLFWSVYTTFSQRFIDDYSSRHYTVYTVLFGTAFLVPFGLPALLRQPWHELTGFDWFALFYSGLLALAFGYSAWYYGVQRLGSTRTSIYSNLTPVAALIFGLIVLQEKLSLLQWIGACIIFAGLILNRMSGAVTPEA